MSKHFNDDYDIPISEYPTNVIPAGGDTFIAIDQAAPNGDRACTCKGFFKDGVLHIQVIIFDEEH